MIVALIDSGLGMLPTAAWLKRLRPDVDQLLFTDPDNAPWGPRSESWIIDKVLATADHAVALGADVIVLPCNTASVAALADTRAHLGADVPVVGTVPAIKPAAAQFDSIAVWATAATTASRYQADLIAQFAGGRTVTAVACHGLADSIDRGDAAGVTASIAAAAAATPRDVQALVLGCTHYPLVVDEIVAALSVGVELFDSAEAVARQTLKRLDGLSRGPGEGAVTVFASGRPGVLPDAARAFEAGRLLTESAVPPRAARESPARSW